MRFARAERPESRRATRTWCGDVPSNLRLCVKLTAPVFREVRGVGAVHAGVDALRAAVERITVITF